MDPQAAHPGVEVDGARCDALSSDDLGEVHALFARTDADANHEYLDRSRGDSLLAMAWAPDAPDGW